ncbi:MAG: hypothetical protein IT381_12505 [Deltaproteobacteria bacterium]|nr:hypothetical protein [Deltaproteobacteria bacterium]
MTARSAKQDAEPELRVVAPRSETGDVLARSDVGNGQAFADEHGSIVRYVSTWQKWIVWCGSHWRIDDGVSIEALAKKTARRLLAEAAKTADTDLFKHAKRSLGRDRVAAMIAMARSEPGIAIAHEKLDAAPLLFNVLNGTIDLTTGQLRKHDPQDLLTRVAPVNYDAEATAPTFAAFIARILDGDEALLHFVHRALGYTLTGDVGEQCLFFLHGAGANGKSTLMRIVLELFGDYAEQGPPGLLMSKGGDAHPTEQAALCGRRLVVCQETEQGKRFAETTVKQLTGGDFIMARRMREDFWKFAPTHKLWLAGNHKPAIGGTDEGIWRRIKLIPFAVTIPEAERDPSLIEKLRAELPGILRWLVEGNALWRAQPLSVDPPTAVCGAVEQYRREQDIFGDFLADCCVLEDGARISRRDIRHRYTTWCEDEGATALGPKAFADRLRERSCRETTMREGGAPVRGWLGVRKKIATDEEDSRSHVATVDSNSPLTGNLPIHDRANRN